MLDASVALIGTGAGVLADLVSSIVLIWRFRAERHGLVDSAHAAERRAQLVSSSCLLILAAGLGAASIQRLVTGHGATGEPFAVTLAACSALVLPILCVWKYRVAGRVASGALRTDAHIGVVAASTAMLTLLGLLATSQLHWTSADPAAALAIAMLAAGAGLAGVRTRPPT